jgi:hypothetical protein
VASFLTALCVGDSMLPISRDPIRLISLIEQLEASRLQGEVRVLDEESGQIIIRHRLHVGPEEGDVEGLIPAFAF